MACGHWAVQAHSPCRTRRMAVRRANRLRPGLGGRDGVRGGKLNGRVKRGNIQRGGGAAVAGGESVRGVTDGGASVPFFLSSCLPSLLHSPLSYLQLPLLPPLPSHLFIRSFFSPFPFIHIIFSCPSPLARPFLPVCLASIIQSPHVRPRPCAKSVAISSKHRRTPRSPSQNQLDRINVEFDVTAPWQ